MAKLSLYPKTLNTKQAERLIESIAKNSDDVIFSHHALERMDERSISQQDVLRVLQSGMCGEAPHRDKKGNWKCKMIRHHKGNRDIGVVTVILRQGNLFIITVEWEDL